MARQALLVVDVQRDFCPGGSLPVKHGDAVVPRLNKVVNAFVRAKRPVFFSRDWHPQNHCSFKDQGGPWPPHCVQGTKGAEFHPTLTVPSNAVIVSKATEPEEDAYSAFEGTGLVDQLRKEGVAELFVGGLATDYCVKESALDALNAGFRVSVMKDCVRGVNVKRADSTAALKEMAMRGARLTTSRTVIGTIKRAQQ